MSRRHYRSRNPIARFFSRLRRKCAPALETIGDWLVFPIKLLFLPYKAIQLFHNRGVNINDDDRRSKHKTKLTIVRFLGWPVRLALYPGEVFYRAFKGKHKRELLFFIPAGVMVLFLAFVAFKVIFKRGEIDNRYLVAAQSALDNNNFALATSYYEQVLNSNGVTNKRQMLNYAFLLEQKGESSKAESILDSIAPNDEQGFPPAHSVKAIGIARDYENSAGETDLDVFKWHLDNADIADAALNRAWAFYYLASGEPKQAVSTLLKAGKEDPNLYLLGVKIAGENGFEKERRLCLNAARQVYQRRLSKNQLDQVSRVSLALIHKDLGDIKTAEKILLDGWRFEPSPWLKRSVAVFYVSIAGDAQHTPTLESQLKLLQKAIALDPECRFAYKSIMSISSDLQSREDLESERVRLQSIVTGDHSTALAHIVLAHVLWKESDPKQANWHLNQAWLLDNEFGAIADKLVKNVILQETPDFEWATQIARDNVKREPDNSAFKDTLRELSQHKLQFDKKNVASEVGSRL